jgi:hypothetical protein
MAYGVKLKRRGPIGRAWARWRTWRAYRSESAPERAEFRFASRKLKQAGRWVARNKGRREAGELVDVDTPLAAQKAAQARHEAMLLNLNKVRIKHRLKPIKLKNTEDENGAERDLREERSR